MAEDDKKCLKKLKRTREIEEKNHEFLGELYRMVRDYDSQPPNFRDIFQPGAIDWLLSKSVKYDDDYDPYNLPEIEPLIDMVIESGYKDEPEVDENGEPLLRHTTAVHHAIKRYRKCLIPDLFKIYDKFHVNYMDDDGLTHFHAACAGGCDDVVRKFLELGQDPNCLSQKSESQNQESEPQDQESEPQDQESENSIDPPLHLALASGCKEVVELLLRNNADPNLTDSRGNTPLHFLPDCDLGKMFLKINDEKHQPLQVDVRNCFGTTPLKNAVMQGCEYSMEQLLKRGADPNLTSDEGSTLLHDICTNGDDDENDELAKKFFNILDKVELTLQVDARDELGRTPLQLAVANHMPKTVDVILDHGAELSSFVFPDESYFGTRISQWSGERLGDFLLRLASGALVVVERLQNRGFELCRSDALTVMRFFGTRELFATSLDIEIFSLDDNELMRELAQQIIPGLSLYNLMRLKPKVANKLVTYEDYFKFAICRKLNRLPEASLEVCALHLCETMSRGFFQQWAMDPLRKLTRYEFPIPCCKRIMDKVMNKDLWNICLAAND